MPLSIKNLHVNVNVNQSSAEGGEGSSTPVSEMDAGKKTDTEKLVRNAVEQIMEMIENNKER